MTVIEIENINIDYEGKTAVNNVSFKLERADYLAIVGENGSGKSSLIKGILGLIEISSGKITIDKHIKQTGIGYLPQQTQVQKDFPARVDEVVISGCLASCGFIPFYSRHEKNIAAYNMERLGITELKKRAYRDLSGGEQQRVLLARALCATRGMLVLDEPAAGLDPVISAEFYLLLKRLNKDEKITVIMVSHDIEAAEENADKVLHLGTEAFFFGTTAEYMNSEIGKRFSNGHVKYN